MIRALTRLAPAICLVAGACVATRNDVRVLQNDLRVMRVEAVQADSARRVQLDHTLGAVRSVDDSLRAVSARLARFQGDIQGNVYSMAQQLIQIQELTGQSQRRLQELRAELEQRSQETATPVSASAATPATDSSARGATPGPNQLFQIALDQLRRGSAGAARSGMADLLRQYPSSDVAPDAQFYIGESYASEGNAAAADSAYQLVVSRYPTSSRAPTALYKHALAQQQAGRVAEARQALDDVVKRFPRSDEAELARERLRTLK